MDARELKDTASGYFVGGRFAKAAELYVQLAELEPHEAQHLIREGDSWRRAGKPEDAVRAYEKAAAQLMKEGHSLRAIAAFKLILEVHPQHEGTKKQLEALSLQRLRGGASPPPPPEKTAPQVRAPQKPKPESSGLELDEPTRPLPPLARRPATPPPEPKRQEPPPMLAPESPPLALDAGQPPEPDSIDLDLGGPGAFVASAEPTEIPVLDLPEPSEAGTHGAESAAEDSGVALEMSEPLPPPNVAGSADAPGAAANFAYLTAETTDEIALVKTASEASTRAPTDMETVLTNSVANEELDEVDPSEIGLVALPDPGEPNIDEVSQERLPLFSALSHEAFLELLNDSFLRRVEEGDVIIREGDAGVSFFVLVKGEVKVVKRTPDGAGTIPLATLGEGAFFGEMALLNGEPRVASVIATTEADVLEIRQALVGQLARAYPPFSKAIVSFYKERLLANVMAISPLFRSLDPEDRPPLAKKFVMRDFAADYVIVQEGQTSDGLYVVMTGAVLVTKKGDDEKVRPIALLTAGDVFGETSLLGHTMRTASVTATRPAIVMQLSRLDFAEAVSVYPTVLESVSELNETRRAMNEETLRGEDVLPML